MDARKWIQVKEKITFENFLKIIARARVTKDTNKDKFTHNSRVIEYLIKLRIRGKFLNKSAQKLLISDK